MRGRRIGKAKQRGFLLNPFRFGGAPAPGGDPYWANVSALLKFDSGAGDAIDSGPLGLTFVKGAAAAYSSNSRFGPYAASFPGGETSRFVAAPHAAFNFGTGAFTVEGFAKVQGIGAGQMLISLRRTEIGIYSNMVRLSSAGKLGWSDGLAMREAAMVVPVGEYFHWAVCRAGDGQLRIFIGGELGYAAENLVDLSTDRGMVVGRTDIGDGQPVEPFIGLMDEIRVTKGVGRYSATFAPPTAPFPVGPP